MSQKKQAPVALQEDQAGKGKEILKIQEFVKKMGGVERAKLAVEELVRLKKSA